VFATNAGKDLLVDPLINRMIGANVTSQPSAAELKNPYTPTDPTSEGTAVRPGLYGLIDTLKACSGATCNGRTKLVAKATCGAVLGSGAVLID
jgi:hypothetical protein